MRDALIATSNPMLAGIKPRPQAHPRELPLLTKFIRQEVGKQGVRQSEFCRAHEFDQGLMSKLMNGIITRISLETAIKLAKGLGCSVSDILIRSGQPELLDLFKESFVHEANLFCTQGQKNCRKCGAQVAEGIALVNGRVTLPDFEGDTAAEGCTQTLSSNAALFGVLKCKGCGHSFTE